MTTTAEYLKFYASLGWQCFPIKSRDKKPLFPNAHPEGDPLHKKCNGGCGKWGHGLNDSTKEVNTLMGWIEQYPSMNIGIATGERSGMWVLDIDAGHGGLENLKALEDFNSPLPTTPTVQTGGGGRHYFFKHPGFPIRNVQNSGKIAEGIDLRGDGGYVVGAGSIHSNGNQYKWIVKPSETPLADAPQWLLKLIQEQKPSPVQEITEKKSAIPNGGRNNTLTSLAGAMRRKGMDYNSVYAALLIENKEKCIPPLSDSEVKQIADSVMRYAPAVSFEDRDRLSTEWAFCKAIYDFPINAPDFSSVHFSMFADKHLSEWWKMVQDNTDVTQASVEAGIMADLERYKDFDVSRLDGYARSIQRFAHLAKIEQLGETLKQQAKGANDAGIDKVINELAKLPPQTGHITASISDVADQVEAEIRERAKNPVDVWGIPYGEFKRLSLHTGGKQKGELILFAGEPKKGKSWWCLQDSLFTAVNHERSVFYWCGEMPRKQLMRRFYQLLGVNGRNMKTGNMSQDDWDKLDEAKALVLNSPLYIDDKPLRLHEVRPLMARMKAEYGIEQFVLDYASKIHAPGKDEIEKSSNISNEIKDICIDLDLAGILIASVNKQGMDDRSGVMKSNVRGSGQQLHDADVIYQFTTFPSDHGLAYGIDPDDYEKCAALNISAGREFESILEGGLIPYMRQENSPKWKELHPVG
jgi:replicative DNA helicase